MWTKITVSALSFNLLIIIFFGLSKEMTLHRSILSDQKQINQNTELPAPLKIIFWIQNRWNKSRSLPGTFEVSTVWTVGGGAAGATGWCTGTDWVGLGGCTGFIAGLSTPELVTGMNPLDEGGAAAIWCIFCPGVRTAWDVLAPYAATPGVPAW